jgi:hypothetical protein
LGDAAMIATGGAAKVASVAIKAGVKNVTAAGVRKTGLILQSSVIGIRGSQGAYSLANGRYEDAGGQIGDAILRLFALKITANVSKTADLRDTIKTRKTLDTPTFPKGKPDPIEKHHSDPKFMGGDPKQPTTPMPRSQHKDLHRDLNKFLDDKADEFGSSMRPKKGNSGNDIQRNFTRKQLLDAEAEFYKKYEHKYPDAARDFFKQHPHLR